MEAYNHGSLELDVNRMFDQYLYKVRRRQLTWIYYRIIIIRSFRINLVDRPFLVLPPLNPFPYLVLPTTSWLPVWVEL